MAAARTGGDNVLELYHNINSVCAQKVRIALKEKGQDAQEHVLTLRGDQNDPAYLKLNPNGVVPTLVHDGTPIVESSLILYYLDEIFPDPPLMPKAPPLRVGDNLVEGIHESPKSKQT